MHRPVGSLALNRAVLGARALGALPGASPGIAHDADSVVRLGRHLFRVRPAFVAPLAWPAILRVFGAAVEDRETPQGYLHAAAIVHHELRN